MNKEEIRQHLQGFVEHYHTDIMNRLYSSIDTYLSTLPDTPKERYFVVFLTTGATKAIFLECTDNGLIFNNDETTKSASEQCNLPIENLSITGWKELSKQDFEYFIK